MILPIITIVLLSSLGALQSEQQQLNRSVAVRPAAIRAKANLRGLAKETTGGLARLCSDNGPDGFAVLSDTEDNENVFIFFKARSFWPTSLEAITRIFTEQKSKIDVLSSLNEFDLSQWDRYPSSPQFVVSTTALEKSDPFYNNVFVFDGFTLYRYRVTRLSFSLTNLRSIIFDITTELVKIYDIRFWNNWNLKWRPIEFTSMYMPRGSTIMILKRIRPDGRFTSTAYFLVEDNMEKPVELHHQELYSEVMKIFDWGGIKYHYELNDKGDIVHLSRHGSICYNRQCKPIRSIVECPTPLNEFTSGILLWIWSTTDLSIVWLGVGLSVIMVLDFLLAIAFLYNQVKHIMHLT